MGLEHMEKFHNHVNIIHTVSTNSCTEREREDWKIMNLIKADNGTYYYFVINGHI